MSRILIIDPDPTAQSALAGALQDAGHDLQLSTTAREGLFSARARRPDLIVTEWLLPDGSAADIFRAMEAEPALRSIPVLVWTQRDEEIDRVVAFELGASDYVVKPVSARELALRVRAILRRSRVPSVKTTVEHRGRLSFDRAAHQVWVDGSSVSLTLLEWGLLTALIDGRGRVLTRATLQEDVWGLASDTTTRTVDTHIKRLRDKLGGAGAYIETVRGIGYRFAHVLEQSTIRDEGPQSSDTTRES